MAALIWKNASSILGLIEMADAYACLNYTSSKGERAKSGPVVEIASLLLASDFNPQSFTESRLHEGDRGTTERPRGDPC